MGVSKWALCAGLLWLALCLHAVHAQTSSVFSMPCDSADIDEDDDGLIEICNLEALNAIRYQLDGSGYKADANAMKITSGCSLSEGCKGYELVLDLDFKNDASYRAIHNKNIWSIGPGWKPIGTPLNPFAAIFKANGHKISNLRIDRNINSVGLFGRTQRHAEIDGLRLFNVDISGDFEIGALVGTNEGRISDSSVENGTLSVKGGTGGGLVGANQGTVVNSYARINLSGAYKVGGLIGDNRGWVANSYAESNVMGSADDVGGLIGHNKGSLINTFAGSRVRGLTDNVGGLVGLNSGIITDSYAAGSMEVEYDVRGRYRVGGLVGYNKHSVADSYAIAGVAGKGYTGGLIGLNYVDGRASESTATNSYWDLTTARVFVSAGGVLRTTKQMQSPTAPGTSPEQSYYGWSTDNWDFGSEYHYPILKYVRLPEPTRGRVACTAWTDDGFACGDLLEGQYPHLSDIALDEGLELLPAFDERIFHYRVVVAERTDRLRLTPTAVDQTAIIDVTYDGGSSRRMNSGAQSLIPLDVATDTNLITVARQYKINVFYPLKIKGIPLNNRISEGEHLRLEASMRRGSDARTVDYRWDQLSGVSLLSGIDTRQPVLEITVPEDLIAVNDESADIVLQVQASDGIITDNKELTLTIVKVENGSAVVAVAAPTFIEETFTLVVPELNLEDLSGDSDGIESLDIVGYQWQSKSPAANDEWKDIKDASEAHYDIPISSGLADRTQYRVRLIYRDGQGYSNDTIVSEKFILPILDLDRDDDGLIEIRYLEDLAAMYYERSGDAYRESSDVPGITRGCPANKCTGYELLRDLDFNDDGSYRDLNNKRRWTEMNLWLYPGILGHNNPFRATFEGNGYTISNLKIHDTGIGFASLFGRTAGKIMNLGLLNVDISGQTFIGGLAGFNEGIIANCYVTGSVKMNASLFSSAQVGGLVGLQTSDNSDLVPLIINSYANVNVQGNGLCAGGLVGRNEAKIINSYAIGDVKGDALHTGGLVGFNGTKATILNGYAIGDIRGIDRIGGLVGHSNGIVKHSYAATKLSGIGRIGGLIGASNDTAQIINSYWDSLIENIHYSAGGTSKTTIELQTSTADESTTETDVYYGWRNADWDFGTRKQYPILKYVQTSDLHQDFSFCINTASDDSALPVCGSQLPDRKRGLSDLTILAEGDISLSPIFRGSLKDYNLTIAGRKDRLNMIAKAIESDALIDIGVDGEIIDKGIESGVASSAILLDSESVIRIVVTVKGKTRDRYTFNVSYIPFKKVDEDGNGLIEIRKLEDLNAIRYNLYGTAYKAAPEAPEFTTGCPLQGCRGYELISDLDFQDDASYRRIENKAVWGQGEGWQPIGSELQPFKAVFKGNIKTIDKLLINRPTTDNVGLFGVVGKDAEIDGVALLNVDILGKLRVGGLAGINFSGTIFNSYVSGHIKAEGGADSRVGGLVGINAGVIGNSHAAGYLTATDAVVSAGGLVGRNSPSGSISDSYATGTIEGGRNTGGLVGTNHRAVITRSYAAVFSVSDNTETGGLVGNNNRGSISNSYWDITIADAKDAEMISSISNGVAGLATEKLKGPAAPGSTLTEVYFNWSTENWDFGTSEQYPALKYNHPDCRRLNVTPCGTVFPNQNYNRLRNLVLSEGVWLVPTFESSIFTYDMYVNADIERIRATPTAELPTFIGIYKDGIFIGNVTSGAVSEPIVLDGTDLRFIVENTSLFAYTIKTHRLDRVIDDIDKDNDGLIEINNLEELNEIRYQPDGTGYRASANTSKITLGCPADGCRGYELDRDLDFEDIASYRNTYHRDLSNKDIWTASEGGWQPIESFNGVFKANGKTLSNLRINRPALSNVGLFADTGEHALIEGVALLDVELRGGESIGSLVAHSKGRVINSYATGVVVADNNKILDIGGLVAYSTGQIIGSYAYVDINVTTATQKFSLGIGGLVGRNDGIVSNSYAGGDVHDSGNTLMFGGLLRKISTGGLVGSNIGTINNAYSTGNIQANVIAGGLIGRNAGSVANSYTISHVSSGSNGGLIAKNNQGRVKQSYWNAEISGQRYSAAGTSATTVQLKAPVVPGEIRGEIYFNWNVADWDFGTSSQYPVLKYRDAHCGTAQQLTNCGALLFDQRFGLQDLKASAGVALFPSFEPETFNYDLTLDADRPNFSLIATAVNFDDRIELSIDGKTGIPIINGESSPIISADSSHITIQVEAKNGRVTVYTIRVHRLAFPITDIDRDNDGLIEIDNLEELDAIRYRLDGSGYRESGSAPVITVGCPEEGCRGYELARDLDFKVDGSYRDPEVNKKAWSEGEGWLPIGDEQEPFVGVFNANGKTLSNLFIDRPDSDIVGLFAELGTNARVEGLGLLDLKLVGNDKVGGLAGIGDGVIVNSYAVGEVEGRRGRVGGLVGENRTSGAIVNSYARIEVSGIYYVGGLVGINAGRIRNCYAISRVVARGYGAGGLVGRNYLEGTIINNYAIGDVIAISEVGGFVGNNSNKGRIRNNYAAGRVIADGRGVGGFIGVNNNSGVLSYNYWDIQKSGIITGIIGSAGHSTVNLKTSTSPTGTIYTGWSTDAWDFGTREQYPILKYIAATDVATAFRDKPACGGLSLVRCGTPISDQDIGLVDLKLVSEGFHLAPHFSRSISNYRLTVFSDTEHIRLIPIAHATDADIRITVGNAFDEYVANATTSSEIPLNTSRTSKVVIEVQTQGGSVAQYVIAVARLRFATSGYRIDRDQDGLIEIDYIEDLHAIRYQPDGRGYRANSTASLISVGCPSGVCRGYELTTDLDFENDDSYRIATINKQAWTLNRGWLPIGDRQHPFTADFYGNRRTISNLKINRPDTDAVGLFGVIGRNARISGLDLFVAEIIGGDGVGIVAGRNNGMIVSSRAQGSVVGGDRVGGLAGENTQSGVIINSHTDASVRGANSSGGFVGFNEGRIAVCYANGKVQAEGERVGGFVGLNFGGVINNGYAVVNVSGADSVGGFIGSHSLGKGGVLHSYAIGSVSSGGQNIGGFGGINEGGTFKANYWDLETSGIKISIAGSTGLDTRSLQSPTTPTERVYVGWRTDIWDFGTDTQYPSLKYTSGVGVAATFNNKPACNSHERDARCGVALSYQYTDLADLVPAARGFHLFPTFEPFIHDYSMTVFADTRAIQLVATAYDANATIRIVSDTGFDEIVTGANESSRIPLHGSRPTVITLTMEKQDHSAAVYTITVNALPFTVKENRVDRDGDGLIEIHRLEDLNAIRYQLDGSGYRVSSTASKITAGCPENVCKGYELAKSLDFADNKSYRTDTMNKKIRASDEGWLPIGDERDSFTAVFDGNNKKISNLKINRPDTDAVGLIGVLGEDGRIGNIGLSDITVTGNNKVGALVGMSHGVIVNIRARGEVTGQYRVGGLVGESDAAIVTSHADISVKGAYYIGGLIGSNEGNITGCYATGDVVAENNDIGGFVGTNVGGVIRNNYAHGDVEGIDNVGGFVGSNSQRGIITNNYAIGKVNGDGTNVGGFAGANSGIVYSRNYWNIQTSGIRTSTLGNSGLDTASLKMLPHKDVYAGWSNTAWHFETGFYPHLKHVKGIAITNLLANEAACGMLSGIVCGTLVLGQRIGLADLYVVGEGLNLLPEFHNRTSDYRVTVYADNDHIRFVPITYGKSIELGNNSLIEISDDNSFSENLANATTSSAIPLNAIGTTTITIVVRTENDETVRYTIVAANHGFLNAGDRVDKDGDGLIELNYLEDLYAIRYQPDGSGYRTDFNESRVTSGCATGGCVGYELVRDLDFEDPLSYRNAIHYRTTWIEGRGWLPIGGEKNPFIGRFNGDGYTISNLTINRPQTDDVALFARLSDEALINNVVLSDIDIRGRHRVGGLVAVNGGNIESSQTDGSVVGYQEVGGMTGRNVIGAEINASFAAVLLRGNVRAGGLVGINQGVVHSSYARGRIVGYARDGDSTQIGGLVGYNDNQVVNSFAFNNVEGGDVVGGLVGVNNTGRTIINSYAINTVSGTVSVGGLVGLNESDARIINSYTDGEVSGGHNIGGLVGANSGTINNTYALGSVSGSRTVGGLVGINSGAVGNSYAAVSMVGRVRVGGLSGVGDSGLITHSYWDTHLSSVRHSAGGEGFGTSVLKAPIAASEVSFLPYYRWRNEDWHFGDTNQYPTLKYTSSALNMRAACSIARELPNCGSLLLPYGLRSLEVSEPSHMSPPFEFSHFNYRLVLNQGESHINLIPTAFVGDTKITVKVSDSVHAVGNSGETIPSILLKPEDETVITIEVAGIVYSLTVADLPMSDVVRDIDDDDDGLIEINYLEDLYAVRYQPSGAAYQTRDEARPVTTGCAVDGCRGYELVRDLDFALDESYRDPNSNKTLFTSRQGWQPIGSLGSEPLNCLFKGNGYSISNLIITRSNTNSVGLFGVIAENAEIDGIGLLNFDIKGASLVGGLVGSNDGGKIVNSYSIGRLSAIDRAGGLVGKNTGTILNSYTGGQISGIEYLGGLIGENQAKIANSYAMNRITGRSHGGGLVGLNKGVIENSYAIGGVRLDGGSPASGLIGSVSSGTIVHSYWDIKTSGITVGTHGIGLGSEALKTPVTAGIVAGDVYYDWPRRDWDFGSTKQYPALKYANGDDTLLPHQRDGLYRLIVSDEVLIFPAFNTHVFDYQLTVPPETDLIRLQAIAIHDNAKITVNTGDLIGKQLGFIIVDIPLAHSGATNIAVTVETESRRSVLYKFVVNRSPAMQISGIPRRAIEEGERIMLDGSHHLDNGSFEYLWTQTSGPSMLSSVVTNRAVLDFTVPVDLLAKTVLYSETILTLEVKAGDSVMKKDLPLIINKRNNGSVTKRFSAPVLRDTELTASVELSSDPDSGGDPKTVAYQWQSLAPIAAAHWRNIRGATARYYAIPASVLDATRYRVLISYVDGQGYIHENMDSEAFTATDIDKDGDGLIEIHDVQDLYAMYYALDGSSYRRNIGATTSTVGCPETGCRGYELSKDLDLRGELWKPVGSESKPFTAIFKGNHYKIFNLNINSRRSDVIGLFGATSGTAEIDGIGLVYASIIGRGNIGSLVGINKGIVSDSYAVESQVEGSRYGVGGLIGTNDGGGNFSALVINSYANVAVYARSVDDSFVIAGGLVGQNINTATITHSYAKGDVNSPCGAGGLVGYSRGTHGKIENSYATGDVLLRTVPTARCREHNLGYIGGLVGINDASVIENSYAIGRVWSNGSDGLGGLVGRSRRYIDTKNSYWNVTTSGVKTSAGGTSKTTVQLQSPTEAGDTAFEVYYDWSSDDWDFGTKVQYPYLKYAPVKGECSILQLLRCDILLSNQDKSTGLVQLILLGGARLVPTFDPKILVYKVVLNDADSIEFIPIAENPNIGSRIGKNGIFIKAVTTGERVSIPLKETATNLITIDLVEPDQRMGRYELHVNHAPEVMISGIPDAGEASEGMRIGLDASGSSDNNEADLLRYEWEQLSGPPLSLNFEQKMNPNLDFIVPEDLVAQSTTNDEVILRVTVSDGVDATEMDIPIRIKKRNNGGVAIDAPEFIGAFTMSAPKIELSGDPDGVGDEGDISYQWQRRIGTSWQDILDASYKTYSFASNTTGSTTHRVKVTYIDGQGYSNTTFSKTINYIKNVDRDGDGLIEIGALEELNAIRYVLDGSGYKESFADQIISQGCPISGCKGYELIRSLDFKHDASYRNPSVNKKVWSEGRGWQPIGDASNSFVANFDGNGYTISNLTIKSGDYDVGFFGVKGNTAKINNIGLLHTDIRGESNIGGLVGSNIGGMISNSYVIGSIAGDHIVGGLVGFNRSGKIRNSYARVDVEGDMLIGGLVAYDLEGIINNNYINGNIVGNSVVGGLIGLGTNITLSNSYMVGQVVAGDDVGGLVGLGLKLNPEAIMNSYWNVEANRASNSPYGIALSTAQMQRPTAPGTTLTEVYYGWNNIDWDFGDESQYPVLKDASGELLPFQRIGLIDLTLSDPARMFPRFNPEIFHYDVTIADDTPYLRVLPIALNADVRINDFTVSSGELSPPITLHAMTTTVIVIHTLTQRALPVQYTLSVNNRFPQVAIDVIPRERLDEGEDIILDVSTGDPDDNPLRYRWSQHSGVDILSAVDRLSGIITDQGTADLSFKIPENLLDAAQDDDRIIFDLTVADDTASVKKSISLYISKKNNGAIVSLPAPILQDESYAVPEIDSLLSQDLDGVTYPDTIQYQWQKYERTRWVDINGETGTSYTPHVAEIDHPYRVFASYTDDQGYRESVASDETIYSTFRATMLKIYLHIRVLLEGLLPVGTE